MEEMTGDPVKVGKKGTRTEDESHAVGKSCSARDRGKRRSPGERFGRAWRPKGREDKFFQNVTSGRKNLAFSRSSCSGNHRCKKKRKTGTLKGRVKGGSHLLLGGKKKSPVNTGRRWETELSGRCRKQCRWKKKIKKTKKVWERERFFNIGTSNRSVLHKRVCTMKRGKRTFVPERECRVSLKL